MHRSELPTPVPERKSCPCQRCPSPSGNVSRQLWNLRGPEPLPGWGTRPCFGNAAMSTSTSQRDCTESGKGSPLLGLSSGKPLAFLQGHPRAQFPEPKDLGHRLGMKQVKKKERERILPHPRWWASLTECLLQHKETRAHYIHGILARSPEGEPLTGGVTLFLPASPRTLEPG